MSTSIIVSQAGVLRSRSGWSALVRRLTAEARNVGAAALGRAVVIGFPMVFVVLSWFAGAGLPYYLDSNETFLSYVHARNLEIWDPWQYGWLTLDGTDPLRSQLPDVYSHNPNAPRYLHYLLLQVGVRELAPQVLILGAVASALTVGLLWRLFGRSALVVVALATVLDFTGFLAWTANTYRVWMFPLFFALVLAVLRRRLAWTCALAFMLFQLEYGLALFVATSTVILAALLHGRRAIGVVLATGLGALISLALFGAQVVAYYGWDGFLHELAITYGRRGAEGDASTGANVLQSGADGIHQLLVMLVNVTYGPTVVIVTAIGLVLALRIVVRRNGDAPTHFAASLTVASFCGLLALASLLHGYFVDAFVRSLLPLPVLLIAPATGVVALELRRLLAGAWRWPGLSVLCGALALLPIVAASVTHFRPPVAADLFGRLQTDYRGGTIIAPSLGAAHMVAELAFALTNGRAIHTSNIDATPEDIRRFEPLRDANGDLIYVCLDTVYLRWSSEPEAISLCDVAVERMEPRGHEIVERGAGWVIMRLNHEDTADVAASTPASRSVQP